MIVNKVFGDYESSVMVGVGGWLSCAGVRVVNWGSRDGCDR